MRVINDKVKVTTDEMEFKSQYNQKFNVMMNIQRAGTGYYAGNAKESKNRLRNLRNEISGEMSQLGSGVLSFVGGGNSFTRGLAYLDDELEEIDREEKKSAQAPTQSYWAVKGQKRARTSLNIMEKRMKKKKK
jgi:hypothetical protein